MTAASVQLSGLAVVGLIKSSYLAYLTHDSCKRLPSPPHVFIYMYFACQYLSQDDMIQMLLSNLLFTAKL